MNTVISLFVCAHTAVDLAQGSTKVKIWYITQRLIDFSTPGELPALSTGQRARERGRVRERKGGNGKDQRAAHFVPQSLTH